MQSPNETHWKRILQCIGYLYNTIDYKLQFRGNEPLKIHAYVDSDFDINKENRHSTTGFLINLGNNPIAWKSKMQPFVALSSSEAEYIALSLCSAALSFSSHILQDFDIKIDFPITIYEDNTGVIFMANNPTIGQQTKHISIKYHHVRELIENNVQKLQYIRSQDNSADVFTKNTSSNILKTHLQNLGISSA